MPYCPRTWCEAHLTGGQHSTNCPEFGTESAIDTMRDHAARAAAATIAAAKRVWRIMVAVMDVAKRHIPWLAIVFTACLIIPGPFDEIGALIVVGIYAAFKPAMRAELAVAIRTK